MHEFTPEQIQAKFEQLPPQLQEAISSPEILDKVKSVAQKHNLLIDQTGELVDQIVLVMLGLAKSSTFVTDTSSRLSISAEQSQAIAKDVNTEVFDVLKHNIMEGENAAQENISRESSVASLERAGGFEIEREGEQHTAATLTTPSYGMDKHDDAHNREETLSHIESPIPAKPTTATSTSPQHTEPMVDQLLNGPASIPEEKVARIVVEDEKKPQPPRNLPTSGDPYREPFK